MRKTLLSIATVACMLMSASQVAAQNGGTNVGESCETPIQVESLSQWNEFTEAGSKWFAVNFPWAAQVKVGVVDGDANITAVEAKSLDCNAVSNVSSVLFPNYTYVKKGINLVKVTVDGPCNVAFAGMNMNTGDMFGMQLTASCDAKPQNVYRLRKMELGVESSYVNAAFETAFSFTPAESGVYTFVNKAPEGSTIKVTELEETADGYSCKEIGDNYFATVGSNQEGAIAVNLTAGTEYIVTSETFALLDEGMPSLKVVAGDATAIHHVKADANGDITVKNLGGGNFQVDSYLFKEGATVGVYNMAGVKLYEKTLKPQSEGTVVSLGSKKADCYLFLVAGKSSSACKNVAVK